MTDIFIHDSANISPKSEIGKGTKIWINVQVRESAIVGENCIISKDVYIDHAVVIGNRCKIQNSVSIYNGVTIGDDVFVGPNVTFTNDKVPRAFNTNWRVTTTLIENGASLGANSTIVCGVIVGCYSMVAAGSVVTKNVPAHGMVLGNPAKLVGYVCECGSKLSENGLCKICDKRFNLGGLK